MSELERFEASMVPAGPGEEPGQGLEPPEFVMVGIRRPGGVTLFVSSSVTDAKFARKVAGYDKVPLGPNGPVAHVPRIHAIVGVEMTSFEQVLADDYPGALRSLLAEWERRRASARKQWQPDPDPGQRDEMAADVERHIRNTPIGNSDTGDFHGYSGEDHAE